MPLTAQEVFPSLSPHQVVVGLELPVEEMDGLLFALLPGHPEHELQIDNTEFVGVTYYTPKPAYSVFDFLECYFGSYDEAINHVITEYFHLATIPSWMLSGIRDQMVQDLKDQRDQFDDILALSTPFRSQSTNLSRAAMYCRRLGLEWHEAARMFSVARGEDVNRVLHYSRRQVPPLDPEELYWIFPYFKNRYTFALLEIHDESGKSVRTVKLNSSRFLYFGLHTLLPNLRQIRVFDSREGAMEMHGHATEMGEYGIGSLHVLTDSKLEVTDPPFEAGVFVLSEKTEFTTLAQIRDAFQDFEIADAQFRFNFEETFPTIPWRDYVLKKSLEILREEGDCWPRLSAMVESLKNDGEVLKALIGQLEDLKQIEIVERIRKQLDPQQVFTVGTMRVSATPEGYFATSSETGVSTQLTNFVIQFEATIWFDESNGIYCMGSVILQGQQFPFLAPIERMLKPKGLLAQIQQATRDTGISEPISPPVIMSSRLQNKLVSAIAQQVAVKPKRVGVDRLGWNRNKSRFMTPCWEAKEAGLQPTSKIFYPKYKLLARCFRFREYPAIQDVSLATPQARYLIALLVASITRAFLNLETPRVMIMRSAHSLALLQAVFAPLGQYLPVELGAKRRLVQTALSAPHFLRYPLYVTCANPSALEGSNYPLFLFSETGALLHEPLPDPAVGQIAGVSQHLISSLILYLIRQPVQAYGLIKKDKVRTPGEMALEGQQIIEVACGVPKFELLEQELPLLESILAHVPPHKAPALFPYDKAAGVIYIRCFKLPQVRRKLLFQELAAKNVETKLHGDRYVVCPAAWFLKVLEKLYGQPICVYP